MTQRNAFIQRGHRRALGLTIAGVLGLAACGGADEEPGSAPLSTYEPTACEDGQRQTTSEATYECADGTWVHAAPTTSPEALKSRPARPTVPPTVPPTVAPTTTVPPPAPVGYIVTNVTNGDTLDVSSTDGQVFTVRVLGIDTPDVGTGCAADLAIETMANLVLGREVALPMGADGENTDQYGRLLRFVEVDGTDVGLALISYGLANARDDSFDGYGNHGREAQYHSADDASIDFSCAPPPPPPAPSAPSAPSAGAAAAVTNPSSSPPVVPVTYTVSDVVDGDTVDIAVSDGTAFRVRVVGIDAPAMDTCEGQAALDAMSALVLGRQVALVTGGGEDTDGDGRSLRYVDVDGIDAGLSQIEQGHAIAGDEGRDGDGGHDRAEAYVSADAASLDWTCIDESDLLHNDGP